MLGLVRHAVFAKLWVSAFEIAGEFAIDLRAAERGLPSALGKNGLRLAPREMPGPE
jgi:hypothetical protein